MKRHAIWAGGIWVALVVIGELLVFGYAYLPAQFAEEAAVVDDAYVLLSALAVPVFALVLAVVIYSVFGFRDRGDEFEDGPPIKTNRKVVAAWLIVTSALAIFIFINPGLVGLAALRSDEPADMVIQVEAQRWQWTLTYPNGAVIREELVLPVDTRVRFDVTSLDILHSFWVPAFRMKIDAVPGRITHLFVTPTRTGTLEDDPGLRLLCAELCGAGHGVMAIPVRVLTVDQFNSWVADPTASASLSGGRG